MKLSSLFINRQPYRGGVNGCYTNSYTNNPTALQSATIDFLRFPLAIAVILIHMNPTVVNLLDSDFPLFSGQGIYNILGITFSHVIPCVAVPTFFVISGFLFFINFKDWNWNKYKSKLRSRLHTLILPYAIWNITPWLMLAIAYGLATLFSHFPLSNFLDYLQSFNLNMLYDVNQWGTNQTNWLGQHLVSTGPYDLPLWFLRDLIVMVLISPIVYVWVKKLKVFGLLILMLCYVSRIWPLIPGFSISAVFFFTLGAYFALNNINIITFVKKRQWYILPTALLFLIPDIIFDGVNTIIGENIHPFFVIAGTMSTFFIAAKIVERYSIAPNRLLVSSCFFVYAAHGCSFPYIGSPLYLCSTFIHQIFRNMPILCYLVTPFVTAALCVGVLQLGRYILPCVTKYYSGNR